MLFGRGFEQLVYRNTSKTSPEQHFSHLLQNMCNIGHYVVETNSSSPNSWVGNADPNSAWFGLGLACLGLSGLAWLGLAWLGLAWLGLACLALPCLGLAWLGLAWFGLASLGFDWLGLACLTWLCLPWLGLA